MTGIYTGPLSSSTAEEDAGLNIIPTTTGEVLGAVAQQGWEDNFVRDGIRGVGGWMDERKRDMRIKRGQSIDEFDRQMLTPDQANERYKLPGMTPFSATVSEDVAKATFDEHSQRIMRENAVDRRQGGIATGMVARFGVTVGMSLLDPVQVAASFFPVVSAARTAAWLGRAGSATARAGVRAGIGAVEGAAGNLALEPLAYWRDQAEQNDWTMGGAAINVMAGAVLGSGLHPLVGRFSKAERDYAARAGAMTPEAREASIRASAAAVIEGRPVPGALVADADRALREAQTVEQIQTAPLVRPDIADLHLKGNLRAPETLLQFIAAKGGIQEQGGDLRAIGATEQFVPGGGMLVRREGGMTLDYAREAAEEAGFLKPDSTIRDFLDAVAEEVSGRRVYRPHDIEAARIRSEDRARSREDEVVEEYRAEIEEIAEAYGVRATTAEIDDSIRLAMDGEHPETAFRTVLAERDVSEMYRAADDAERAAVASVSARDADMAEAEAAAIRMQERSAGSDGTIADQIARLEKDVADAETIVRAHDSIMGLSAYSRELMENGSRNAEVLDGYAKAWEAAGVCRAVRG